MKTPEDFKNDFQTPPEVAEYMAMMCPWVSGGTRVLEPTPGKGNIVNALKIAWGGHRVIAPDNYFDLNKNQRFDCIVMNPPFSEKSMWGAPDGWVGKGMRVGYKILQECMGMSDNIIALMPAFTLSDSDVRAREIKRFGLVSVTQLPRKTFDYARIQTVILHLKKGYTEPTEYKLFDLLNKETYQEEL